MIGLSELDQIIEELEQARKESQDSDKYKSFEENKKTELNEILASIFDSTK